MKNGLLALMLLSLVAAIPACRQRDCLDKDRGCETKCNPCNWFKCKPKCDKEEKIRKPRKKCASKCNPCNWFKCKPKCEDQEMMDEEVRSERVVRQEMAPRAVK